MKDIFKSIPFATLIIAYLFICGGLYLVGFWGTFNIDAFGLIDTWEIPKHFTSALVYSGGASFIMMIVATMTANHLNINTLDFSQNPENKLSVIARFLIIFGFVMSGLFLSKTFHHSLVFWSVIILGLATMIILEFLKSNILRGAVKKEPVRLFIVAIIILTPSLSFLLGKKQAIHVYKNESLQTTAISIENIKINKIISDTMPLKFLGFLGDKLIISSINNERIYILNQSEVGAVRIDKREKP